MSVRVYGVVKRAVLLLLVQFLVAEPKEDAWLVDQLVTVDYPKLAQQAVIYGIVTVTCTLSLEGRPTHCQASGAHPLLRAAAVENAMKWRWRKSLQAESTSDDTVVRYEFVLRGACTRERPRVEFSFRSPNTVRVLSRIPCVDHGL